MNEAEGCVILCPRLEMIPGASYLYSHFQKAGLGLEKRTAWRFPEELITKPKMSAML